MAQPTSYQEVFMNGNWVGMGGEIRYVHLDGIDDSVSTALPAITNGTVVIAGTNGIWIDDDFNHVGGAFTVGTDSYTNGPNGILPVLGDLIVGGSFVIDRQLTAEERTRVIDKLKSMGAPGVFELGPELVVNGDFSDGLDGWSFSELSGSPTVEYQDGRAIVSSQDGDSFNFVQTNVFPSGGTYILRWEVEGVSSGYRYRGPVVTHSFAPGINSVQTYEAGGAALVQRNNTSGSSTLVISHISAKKLELIP